MDIGARFVVERAVVTGSVVIWSVGELMRVFVLWRVIDPPPPLRRPDYITAGLGWAGLDSLGGFMIEMTRYDATRRDTR